MDEVIISPDLLQQLRSLPAVLLREHLPVDVMKEADQAPVVLIFAKLPGKGPHHSFHTQCMMIKTLALIVFPEQCLSLLSCKHSLTSLMRENIILPLLFVKLS